MLGLVACEPPPPRLLLAVTTTAGGTDTDPGDGVCLAAGGGCTLQAAIEEANASPDGADVALPAGTYGGFDATVTGDVRINPASQPVVTIAGTTFTVAVGGRLDVHGVNTSTSIAGADLLDLHVAGTAAAVRSVLDAVEVDAGGVLALSDSAVTGSAAPSVQNDGTLVAVRTSLLANDVDGSPTDPVLHTGSGATSHLAASVVAQPEVASNLGISFPGGAGTCTGAAPTFTDRAVAEVPATCGLAGPAAPAGVRHLVTFDHTYAQIGFEVSLDGGSPLVDAIPLGDPACDTSAVDLYGTPRGVDGNGDGVAGCDIGAVERPVDPDAPVQALRLTSPGNTFAGPGEGFWAHVHGPGAGADSGDAVNTRCLTELNADPCTTGSNPDHRPPDDPDQGVWYAIEAPPAGGPVTVSIYDAQLTLGSLAGGPGDSAVVGNTAGFTTTYRVYQQADPADFHGRVPVGAASPDTESGSCHWAVDGQVQFQGQWVPLCTIEMNPGSRYLLNVRTAERPGNPDSAARNGYAVRACSGDDCTAPGQPTVHAVEQMVLYNNIPMADATFHLAEVGPQYAGRTLVVELWDPGEAAGQAWIFPRMPSTTQPGAVQAVDPAACEITSTRVGFPRTSDLHRSGQCSVRTSDGIRIFDGHWVTMRIQIPASYSCTLGVDPDAEAGSCWWGIRYSFTDAATDTTTWRAHIDGDPVALIE